MGPHMNRYSALEMHDERQTVPRMGSTLPENTFYLASKHTLLVVAPHFAWPQNTPWRPRQQNLPIRQDVFMGIHARNP